MEKMKTKLFLVLLLALILDVYGRAINDEDMDNSIQADPDDKVYSEPQEWVKFTKVPPANVYHESGTVTEIECEALGSPIPEVQWVPGSLTREMNLIPFSGPSTLVKSRSILVIDRLKHTKTYSCIASAAGKQIRTTTTVHVKKSDSILNDVLTNGRHEPKKPKIIHNYSLYLETIGSTIVLPCTIAPNRHKTEKYWLDSNGNVVTGDNPRLKINNNGDLMIIDLKWEDMGAYKCVAENSIGRDAADTFVYPALSEDE